MLTLDHRTCKSKMAAFFSSGMLLMLLSAGCTTVERHSYNVVQDSNVESAYIAVGADFGKYNQLLADDMGIFFP